ncbi:peptidase domain-containing ABC transporter [Frigoriflavimonas asaccharolytica]|uniref:ABC-type bacteriocin/lantibiotic exporter with double-glycine peptidase domain n=1 Tax=Frigoriflavimonas asaccharolytica TaxID=2735899 RepID=A0A8J8KAS4_9FLAO|nr:ATP-binding cassette domain-containing protein [Frigoriflavimonas asaccharolytica]NRS91774.1 ABC-type bacteriocin/lantibiotic exporter with double-glycine peptidase domain [Frigoriflavimonas asaccharolytica]
MILNKRFWKLVNLDKSDIGSIYFYAIINGLLQLSVPLGIQAIIGFVLGARMVVSIYILIALVCLGVFLAGVMQINQLKIIESIKQKIFTRYAFEFVDKIPKFDLYKTDQYYLPEQVNRFFDTINLQKGFAKLLLDIPTALTQILFGFILLSFYNPLFLTSGLVLLIIISFTIYFSSKTGLETSLQESSSKYAVVSWLESVAKSIITFKFSNKNQLEVQKTDTLVVDYLNKKTSHFKVLLFQYKTMVGFQVIITASLLTIGVYLLIDQQINIGEFIAAEIVILSIIASVKKIIINLDSVYDVQTALEKLAYVTEKPTEIAGKIEFNSDEMEIQMTDFGFAHPDSRALFKDIELHIPAKSLVCVVGNENSGKSTFLKLLSACYTEFSGNILYNHIPINNYNLSSLRDNIQYYQDTGEIFSGTIFENISMGKEYISETDIIKKAELIGFSKFLKDFGAGFQTRTESEGKRFSNNAAQKILLLRAITPNSSLLIMEEPWGKLDPKYKNSIIEFLLQEKKHKTIIIATDDKEFAAKCDYRIEVKDGNLQLN